MFYRVSSHTDTVGSDSVYVAIPGTKFNGLDFIPEAIARGAVTVVIPEGITLPEQVKLLCEQKKVKIETVPNIRAALAHYSARAYGYPAQKLSIIGVTGTDGKTTSAYLLYTILKQAGFKTALLSGVQIILEDTVLDAQLTTAKPDFLHYFFDQCVQKNITHVVMEVAAQAHTLNRIDKIEFSGLIFTNLAKEHGEMYPTLQDYFDAKCGILHRLKPGAPLVINIDTEWGKKARALFPNSVTCGTESDAQYRVQVGTENLHEQELCVFLKNSIKQDFITPLTGLYNAINILGVTALCVELGISLSVIKDGVRACAGAPGRLQKFVLNTGALAIVDYAHTPQAFNAILPHVRRYAKRLFVIFGCGGGKDPEKRPLLGTIAAQLADRIILTNDNPRFEDQFKIMDAVMSGLTAQEITKFTREPDRAHAIQLAYQEARDGDIIAILGKGPETEQLIGTLRLPHSDIEVVQGLV